MQKEPVYEELMRQAYEMTEELCKKAKLCRGQILIVGCSTSEICGKHIGSNRISTSLKLFFSGYISRHRKTGSGWRHNAVSI